MDPTLKDVMAMSFSFEDYYDVNETLHSNQTYVVDPNTLSCKPKPLDPSAALSLSIICISIFLLAIPGNLLVGLVIGASRQSLTPSDVYLLHLTIADGLMALTLPFFSVALVHGWVFKDFMCKLVNLVFEANFYTSILFLACISVDRYRVIVRANESLKKGQRRCSRRLCAAVWVLGVALALPALFNDAFRLEGKMFCRERFDLGRASSWKITTRALRHVFGFLLPVGVMTVCYGVTVARLLKTRGFRKHRAMRVIIAVVIAFLLCWTPYHLTLMVDTLLMADLIPFNCSLRTAVDVALVSTNCLALLHSCINPVLYAFVGEKFRKNMKVLLLRKVRQERASGSKFSRSTSQTSDNGAVL